MATMDSIATWSVAAGDRERGLAWRDEVTRRMIEAYPEDQLFTFSVGGMRPFGELVREMLGMGAPMIPVEQTRTSLLAMPSASAVASHIASASA